MIIQASTRNPHQNLFKQRRFCLLKRPSRAWTILLNRLSILEIINRQRENKSKKNIQKHSVN